MSPPERQRPLLIFDGDCRFCRAWVDHWRDLTGDAVDYAPFQEVGERFPEISREEFERSVQLVLVSGRVLQGARAVFRVLREAPGRGWLEWAYEHVPGLARASEAVYRAVADRRELAYRLNRWLWGDRVPVASYSGVRWLLLRGMGIVYLCAFVSLWLQIPGLIGDDGILPAGRYLDAVGSQLGWRGLWYAPTLAWLRPDTAFLQALAASGAAAAALATVGILTLPALLLCWVAYLSLVTAGQEFLAFQWDILLLEAGFLSMFLAPRRLLSRPSGREPVPAAFVWLTRLLLFRLMFSSGAVKLLSGDPAWRDLTALSYHYETQPLPTPLAWMAHQLPDSLQRLSTGAMFAVELLVPFLFFAPRRPRVLAAAITVLFQVLLAATGNYAFFNLLTVVLCISLLDDALLGKLVLTRMGAALLSGRDRISPPPRGRVPASRLGLARGAVAVLIVLLGLTQLAGLFVGVGALPPPLPGLYTLVSPFRVVNGYGLFAVMTKTRPEIVVEGSRDGERWHPYAFRYKPQDPTRAPGWVAPHQPRLDWQMWFAALGGPRQGRWFVQFAARLLQGSPEVLALLEDNPFPGEPPRYVRATLYRYRFTEAGDERETGKERAGSLAGAEREAGEGGDIGDASETVDGEESAAERWWRRERLGPYLRPISLSDLR